MPEVIVVDTNVWVSAFINPRGAPARIREAFARGEFQTVVSVPLLDEVAEISGSARKTVNSSAHCQIGSLCRVTHRQHPLTGS